MRSRPATILRPAPAALPRPVPTTPLTRPIGGANLHEASSEVHSRSPITHRTAGSRPRAGKPHDLPAGLLLARRHRMEQQRLRLRPRASHPAVTHDARRGGDGPSRTGPGTTPRPQPPSMAPPTSLMRPHVAPSHTSLPAPPRVTRQRGPSLPADTPGHSRSEPTPCAHRSRSSAPAPTGADADQSPRSVSTIS